MRQNLKIISVKPKNTFVFSDYAKGKEIFSLKLSITTACNLNCQYCFVDKNSRYLNLKTAYKAIDFFLFSKGEEKILILYGGEPLLHPLLKKIIIYTEKRSKNLRKKIIIALPTNGLLLNKNILHFLKNHNVRLSISIDGAKESHNLNKTFPNGKGSFEVIAKNAFLAREIMGTKNLSALMTIAPDLSGKLFNSFKSLLNLGFKKIHIDPVHGVKWNKKRRKIFLINFNKIIRFILKNIEKDNFIFLNPLFFPLVEEAAKGGSNKGICPFYLDLEIYPAGEISFSQFLLNSKNSKLRERFIIGNIREGNLRKKYRKCHFDFYNKRCQNCWADYYGSVKDPKHQGSEIVFLMRKFMEKAFNYIQQKSLYNLFFRKYLNEAKKYSYGH